MVSSVAPAVTSPARWLRAPDSRFTAVWDMPPPAGMAPSTAPPAVAMPVASSSRLGFGVGSPGATKARPTAAVSVKLMTAMPRAAGHSAAASETSGHCSPGRPRGICPTVSTPAAPSPSRAIAAMPAPTATRGAGRRGVKRSMPASSPIVSRPTASVTRRGPGQALDQRQQVLAEGALRVMRAEQLGQLVHDDHEADAGLEADQHRLAK